MAVVDDRLAEEFTEYRPHLIGVAYRLTGSLADAEDAVQEAWLRLSGLDATARQEIRELRAWLTTVVGRICLDRLRSAAVRREAYVGPWLPEPLVTPIAGNDPLEVVVQEDGVRMAALVVLERLTPEQRVAFVLHDAFDLPFAEIAEALGCSVAAARQHASRGRKAVADADPPPRASLAEQREVLELLVSALSSGDLNAVLKLLHPDAMLIGDGGGKARTAQRLIVGADKVARFVLGLLERYGSDYAATGLPALVNGDLGMLIPEWPGDADHPPADRRVSAFAIRDGKVLAFYDVVNPDKLTHLEF